MVRFLSSTGAEPPLAPAPVEPRLSHISNNRSKAGIIRNILASYVATFVGSLVGFIATPLLLRRMGKEQFGLWMLLLSVMGYVGLVELGISSAVSKRVSECAALEDSARLKQVLGTALTIYGGLALLAWIIIGVVALKLDFLFQIPAGSLPVARLCLLTLGVNQTLKFFVLAQSATLLGIGRMDIGAGISAGIITVSTIMNVALVLLGYSLVALAWNMVLATLLSGLITARIMRQKLPGITLDARSASIPMARELLKFGSRNATISLMGTIAYSSDMLILGRMLPVAAIADYSVAAKVVDLIILISGKPVGAMLPVFSDANARQDTARHFTVFTRSLGLCLVIALPFVAAICIIGDYLIAAWVGPGHHSSYIICAALALMMFVRMPGSACYVIMTATERNVFLARMLLIASPVNLALSIGLTRLYGAVGVALGSLITVAVTDFMLLPWRVCRDFGFSYRSYVRKVFAPLFAPLLAALVLAFACRFGQPYHGRLAAVLALALIVCGAWTAWFFTGVSAEQRAAQLLALRRRLSRVAS